MFSTKENASIRGNNVGVTVNLYVIDMKAYASEVLPAVHAFIEEGRSALLIALLQRGRCSLLPHESEKIAVEDFALYERILEDFGAAREPDIDGVVDWNTTKRTIRDIVNSNIAPALVYFYCLIRKDSQIVKQNISEKPFVSGLYAHSPWVQSLFTFETPVEEGSLEIPIGESTGVLSKDQVERLLREVQTYAYSQDSTVFRQYDHLQDLLNIALNHENMSVVISVS
jgi:hypothetical protein